MVTGGVGGKLALEEQNRWSDPVGGRTGSDSVCVKIEAGDDTKENVEGDIIGIGVELLTTGTETDLKGSLGMEIEEFLWDLGGGKSIADVTFFLGNEPLTSFSSAVRMGGKDFA